MIAYGLLFLWFDPFYPSQYFFSQGMWGWLLLGWTGTGKDVICLANHVCLLRPCGHLLGKGWPLGSLVCDVFLCLCHLPIPCPRSCVVLDCINSRFCLLLYFAQWQYAVPPVKLKPVTFLSRLKHSTTGYCTFIIVCGDNNESLMSRSNISYTFWREFLFHFC